MGVGDYQPDADQAAALELAQEFQPERFGFGGADIYAEYLASAVGVDCHSHGHRDRDDASLLPYLYVGRIDPEIGPIALNRPVQECLDPLVDLFAQSADLAFGDAAHAHGLDQIVHRAG